MELNLYIATPSTATGIGYALLADGKVISTHATVAEAVKARDEQNKSRGAQVPSDASDGTAPKPDPPVLI